ncbi:MAG TPA: hypothetical protein VED40_10220 [Azospirillaceae bacterium]|nr:hypothetical protein [Azospirillaceae bacterium]
MLPPRTDSAARWGSLAFLVLGPLAFGALALAMGQDANWDLRNYHWYNAYAYVTGRWDLDVAPAQLPTFYNPTLDIPFFLLADAVPARVAGFVLGALQGANLVLLYGLAWTLLRLDPRPRALSSAALALLGMLGGGTLGLLGTTFYDNVISLFVLGGALLVTAAPEDVFRGPVRPAFIRVGIAGFLVGSAVGLKQPSVIFAVGFCFAFLFVAGSFWRRLFLSFFFGIGVLAAMAVFSGHWMWFLWTDYANPLFPYFNDLFRSPMGVAEPYRDDKFIPHGLDALLFPFLWAADPKEVGEIIFRDYRVMAMLLVLLATPLMLLAERLLDRTRTASVVPLSARYLLVSATLIYLVWLKLFAIYRYLIPLEMLAPIVIAAAIAFWPLSGRARLAVVAAVLALVAVTAKPGTWGRIPFGERFVEIQAPELPRPDETLVLMTGYAPTSFLVYGFPPQVPFLRLQSYLVHPDHGETGINLRMRRAIEAHKAKGGDFFLLIAHWEVWTIDNVLPAYGMTADAKGCAPVTSNLDEPMMLCPARPLAATGAAPTNQP